MTIQDGFKILRGGDGAATAFLRDNTTEALIDAFSPKVQNSIEKVKLTEYWNPVATRYNQARSAMTILEQIMNSPEEQALGRRFVHHPDFKGDILFKDVSFRYPHTEHDVLTNINLNIKAGEKVAIIGRIGSGKTTLERLVVGLYKPTGGALRIDGIDIGQLQPASLRKNIGCVPQDVTLFYGTIRDNIVIANPLADENQVLRAAQRAGVTLFTNQDPDGLDKQVGEGGRQLSGGQRQAIAPARRRRSTRRDRRAGPFGRGDSRREALDVAPVEPHGRGIQADDGLAVRHHAGSISHRRDGLRRRRTRLAPADAA